MAHAPLPDPRDRGSFSLGQSSRQESLLKQGQPFIVQRLQGAHGRSRGSAGRRDVGGGAGGAGQGRGGPEGADQFQCSVLLWAGTGGWWRRGAGLKRGTTGPVPLCTPAPLPPQQGQCPAQASSGSPLAPPPRAPAAPPPPLQTPGPARAAGCARLHGAGAPPVARLRRGECSGGAVEACAAGRVGALPALGSSAPACPYARHLPNHPPPYASEMFRGRGKTPHVATAGLCTSPPSSACPPSSSSGSPAWRRFSLRTSRA